MKRRLMTFAVGLLVFFGATAFANAWTSYSISIAMTNEARESGVGRAMLSVCGAQDAQAALLAEDHAALSTLFIEMLREGKGSLERDGYVIEAELTVPLDTAEGQFYGEEGSVYNLHISDWPFAEETTPATIFLRAEEGVLWESIESYGVPLSDGSGDEEAAAEQPAPAPATEAPKKEEAPEPMDAPNEAEAPKPTEAPKQEEAPKPTEAPKATEAPKPTEAQKETEAPKQEAKPDAGDSAPAATTAPEETTAPSEAQAPQSQQPQATDSQPAGEATKTQPGATIEAPEENPAQVEEEPIEEDPPEEEPAEEAPHAQVQFMDFDGFILSQASVPIGEAVDIPKDPPKHTGLKFAYWYNPADEEDTPFSFGSAVMGDITLKACYAATIDPPQAPEETLEPAAQEEPDFEAQLEEIGDESLADLIIKVDTVYASNMKLGDPITLEGTVENLPGDRTARYQWQNNQSGTFEDIPDATGLRYTFTSTAENLQWKWRLVVTLDSPEIAQN